jgi:hypothetical protein
MDARNPFPFNRLRTLSIAMGVYTPSGSPSSAVPSGEVFHKLEIRPSQTPLPSYLTGHRLARPIGGSSLCASVSLWPSGARLYFSRCAVRDSQAALRSLHP